MSNRVFEGIRVDHIMLQDSTASAKSLTKVRLDGNANFGILCQFLAATRSDTAATAAAQSATVAGSIKFSVYEATAASAAGTVITGATMSIGAATAAQVRGGAVSILQVTSDLTTATIITINGITYQTTKTGVGTSGEWVAANLASAINGNCTSPALPHYEAIPNFNSATGMIMIQPKDDLGAGLTMITTAAGSPIVVFPHILQGVITVAGGKLSTESPKYIGVECGESTAVGIRAVSMLRVPTGAPAFPGRLISVTT
jgi:hypothetical protein